MTTPNDPPDNVPFDLDRYLFALMLLGAIRDLEMADQKVIARDRIVALSRERAHKRAAELDGKPRCQQCKSPLNAAKVARRGGRCACGATVQIDGNRP